MFMCVTRYILLLLVFIIFVLKFENWNMAFSQFCKRDNKHYKKSSKFVPRFAPRKEFISERFSNYVIGELDQSMRTELSSIIGRISDDVQTASWHPKCTLTHTNSFLGVFTQFFVKKCVFNLQGKDGHNSFIQLCASIFPFKVTLKVEDPSQLLGIAIIDSFDGDFCSTIQSFLDDHFDDEKFCDLSNLFLANINSFKNQHFSQADLDFLDMAVKGNANIGSSTNSYLKTFPRLNSIGAARYIGLYETYKLVVQLYGKSKWCQFEADEKYFRSLPELNFHELFSLLDVDLFQQQRQVYVQRFQKYLFFFIGALRSTSEPPPIFFIDQRLFDCLKSLQIYKKSRDDVMDLLYHVAMLTLLFRRRQEVDHIADKFETDTIHLKHVKGYVEAFPGIETAIVDYERETDVLTSHIGLCLEKTILEVKCKEKDRLQIHYFHEQFLSAAFSDRPIEELIIYNAFTGMEARVKMVDDTAKEKIRNFIAKYNKYDFSVPIPTQKYLTWGLDKFFEKGTLVG